MYVAAPQTNHFPIGQIMMKHLTVRSGQCPCQKYFPEVMERVQSGEVDPTLMITHRISLDEVRLRWCQCVNLLPFCCVYRTERGGWCSCCASIVHTKYYSSHCCVQAPEAYANLWQQKGGYIKTFIVPGASPLVGEKVPA
jgi:hypothetical protein